MDGGEGGSALGEPTSPRTLSAEHEQWRGSRSSGEGALPSAAAEAAHASGGGLLLGPEEAAATAAAVVASALGIRHGGGGSISGALSGLSLMSSGARASLNGGAGSGHDLSRRSRMGSLSQGPAPALMSAEAARSAAGSRSGSGPPAGATGPAAEKTSAGGGRSDSAVLPGAQLVYMDGDEEAGGAGGVSGSSRGKDGSAAGVGGGRGGGRSGRWLELRRAGTDEL